MLQDLPKTTTTISNQDLQARVDNALGRDDGVLGSGNEVVDLGDNLTTLCGTWMQVEREWRRIPGPEDNSPEAEYIRELAAVW